MMAHLWLLELIQRTLFLNYCLSSSLNLMKFSSPLLLSSLVAGERMRGDANRVILFGTSLSHLPSQPQLGCRERGSQNKSFI